MGGSAATRGETLQRTNVMTPDVDRIAKALRMQSAHARALLEHRDRDPNNFHLALAGIVRSMLCDAQWPTLLAFAGALSVDLRVWGPYPPSAGNEKPPAFAFNALIASAEPVGHGYEMSAEEYLDAPIGAIAIPTTDEAPPRATWYTPRQLIKWAANKEGPSHFDPKSVPTFSHIGAAIGASGSVFMIGHDGSETPVTENDNLILRVALLQIAQTAVVLADMLLSHYDQQRGT